MVFEGVARRSKGGGVAGQPKDPGAYRVSFFLWWCNVPYVRELHPPSDESQDSAPTDGGILATSEVRQHA